jgi:hypothetical protein
MANRGITKENAMQMVELRRSMGKMGGRPPGVLDKRTIEKTKTIEAFVQVVKDKAGFIADNLLQGSQRGDTSASKELLERAFGKVPQGVQMQVATFSLKELAEYRKGLQNPPVENTLPAVDPVAIALPDALEKP